MTLIKDAPCQSRCNTLQNPLSHCSMAMSAEHRYKFATHLGERFLRGTKYRQRKQNAYGPISLFSRLRSTSFFMWLPSSVILLYQRCPTVKPRSTNNPFQVLEIKHVAESAKRQDFVTIHTCFALSLPVSKKVLERLPRRFRQLV